MDRKRINPLKTPVYRDSGFRFESAGQARQAFEQEHSHKREPDTYIYSRYRNPTVVAVEEQLMALEEAPWALLTQSGMAAIDVAVSIFQQKETDRPWLFFSEIYGGTNSFIDHILVARRGVNIHRFFPTEGSYDMGRLEILLQELQPEFLFFEAVSNPMLIVADALQIISLAKRYGCRILVDNTFATPYLWKPLGSGADLVIHSATKYLAGHGDLTAGVLCGSDPELMAGAIQYRKYVGHMLSPDDAYRLGTQLCSFDLRMHQHCSNTAHLARLLDKHPGVEQVFYPGLEKNPSHQLASKLFAGKAYGGMISFDLAGKDRGEKQKNMDRLIAMLANDIPLVPSLGDSQTSLLPIEAVWGDKFPFPGMIRLSVGIEDPCRLGNILSSALDRLEISSRQP